MGFQATLARICGDAWKSWRIVGIWPWPAVCIGFPHSKFNWLDYRFFCHFLRPGDFILMTSEKYFLSNRGISGTAFKHLAVYTGAVKGEMDENGFIHRAKSAGLNHRRMGPYYERTIHDRTVTHAISDGVVCQDLGSVLFHEDYAVVVRPWTGVHEQFEIVHAALGQIGKGYNFDFTSAGPPELYCTELGEFCCIAAKIVAPARIKQNVDWKGVLLPLERFKAYVTVADRFILHFPVVACSNLSDNAGFLNTSAWAEELRAKFLAAEKTP